MAYRVKLQVLGLRELDQLFRSMPDDLKDSILKSVHRKAMQPILEKAREIAPVQSASDRSRKTKNNRGGTRTVPLKESIKAVSGGSFSKTQQIGLVRGGALRRKPYRAYHAGLVEFGTDFRKPGGWWALFQKGKDRTKFKYGGFTKMPSPSGSTFRPGLMGPAFEAKIGESRKLIVDLMSKRIQSRIKRLIRKNIV